MKIDRWSLKFHPVMQHMRNDAPRARNSLALPRLAAPLRLLHFVDRASLVIILLLINQELEPLSHTVFLISAGPVCSVTTVYLFSVDTCPRVGSQRRVPKSWNSYIEVGCNQNGKQY